MLAARRDRTLVLLRHAKAGPHGSPDHERPLADRGHADAAAAGRWLAEHDYHFALVVCSTSVRTRETWDGLASAGVAADDVSYDSRVYEADVPDLFAVLADVPDDAEAVLVVGHSPGIPALADELADGERSDHDAVRRLDAGFATCAIAVLEHDGEWADLGPGAAVLTRVETPRG